MRQSTRNFLALLWLALFSTQSAAHDFWIEPEHFRPKAGVSVPIRLFVGQDFTGEPVPYIPETIERYMVATARGIEPVQATTGDDPAGSFVPTVGLSVIAYESQEYDVKFDSYDEFERYLKKEGLERHIELAAKHRERGNIKEIYTRHAKALLVTPGTSDIAPDRAMGLAMEFLADAIPYGPGEFSARLLFHGEPLEDSLVILFRKDKPLEKIKVRTDKQGRVVVRLPAKGIWLATSVHMVRAPFYARHDWRSFWASLTFEVY